MIDTNVSEIFACNVFDDSKMKERLPKDVYNALQKTIEDGVPLSMEDADVIADKMKEWAIERGATHYTHWFQPLTGITAEKHDGFIDKGKNGEMIMKFSGKNLIKGEPDASSFPSGGLRATFEARGYTEWDYTSPAFLKQDKAGVTLCVPTVFYSYTGEALDKKTPLLKSNKTISEQAIRVLRFLGDTKTKRVTPSVGAEQEYFLIPRDYYMSRQDLKFTGVTLFGAEAPKGQELDDHYFGAIRGRLAEYMRDLDSELYKLGVYAKTKHNEVAPCQHELACIYEDVNKATDHNQLVMEEMRRVALRYNLVCLLTEKPFKGINGSGKHNNWSLSTDSGENLLEPGVNPASNRKFLLFLCACIKAVDENADIIRAAAANVGNDARLGGNEAPPCVISMFLGEDLCDVLEYIENGKKVTKKSCDIKEQHSVVKLEKDTSDRNRTSPIAFTGNKFEYRMVGSSASIAGINTIINTTVADSLCQIADRLEKAKDVDSEIDRIISEIIKNHKRILFNGNGYSKEWIEEATKRGLSNIQTSLEAFYAYLTDDAVNLFEKHKIYTKNELYARFEIHLEKYIKYHRIEARTMISMVNNEILPAVIKCTDTLAKTVIELKQIGVGSNTEGKLLEEIIKYKDKLYTAVKKLNDLEIKADSILSPEKKAFFYKDNIIPQMSILRDAADNLEKILPKDAWPLASYSDILFYR